MEAGQAGREPVPLARWPGPLPRRPGFLLDPLEAGRRRTGFIYAATFILALAFYWWTPHVLLLGRVAWGRLFPGAVATAAAVTGLGVFSAAVFSGQIVSSEKDYGPIGVLMVLLSYLIGLGVCIHLGAVAGRMWIERGPGSPADPGELPDAVNGQEEGSQTQ